MLLLWERVREERREGGYLFFSSFVFFFLGGGILFDFFLDYYHRTAATIFFSSQDPFRKSKKGVEDECASCEHPSKKKGCGVDKHEKRASGKTKGHVVAQPLPRKPLCGSEVCTAWLLFFLFLLKLTGLV